MSARRLYGLIGFPLGHTFSPGYFNSKFVQEEIDAEYRAFPLASIRELPQLLELYPNLSGLNVTTPYKEQVISLLDELDEVAADVGAVNCIRITDGRTKGYNTDVTGFEQSLRPLLTSGMNKAIVLGTGGAARAVKYVLNNLRIQYINVSRTQKDDVITYNELSDGVTGKYRLIINATPLGMYPCTESYPPIPYDAVSEEHILYDLIYNPAVTAFLQKGQQRGATTKNGMEMLELQAEASWDIWNS
ncbi:MAG TPA: shikimate dehydrogenase [Flavipsychrobacter sp.]|nr:shikimate dehydrogenase [Flavipsychrobacter sp.]